MRKTTIRNTTLRNTLVITMAALLVSTTALAQFRLKKDEEKDAIAAITEVGGTCETIIRAALIAELPDKTRLMGVECSGGKEERYVIQLDRRSRMSFYSTCEQLAEVNHNQVLCFR